MKQLLFIIFLCCFLQFILWSSAQSESSAGERGNYLAERQIILPPDEVYLESFIASVDYNYPEPDSPSGFKVSTYTGHQQIYKGGQEEIIQIGIQSSKTEFMDLPPMNLAFVIDHGVSMSDPEKLEWVKNAFNIFVKQVRDFDYISVIIFNDNAEVLFPATKMDSQSKKNQFISRIQSIIPKGNSNFEKGLVTASLELLKNFNNKYVNRVMLLSDGLDSSESTNEDILEIAEQFNKNQNEQ